MKAFIAVVLVLILGCLGYMIWDKKRADFRQEQAALTADLVRQEAEIHEAKIARAVREGIVQIGMSAAEVQRSWGRPRSMLDVGAEYGNYGIYHEWDYPMGIVQFSAEGKVVRMKLSDGTVIVRQ